MEIKPKTKVRLDYEVISEGKVVDKAEDAELFIGFNLLVKGFEKNLIGLKPGEEKQFDIAPNEAYGDYKLELIQKIPREQFPKEQQNLFVKGKMLQMYVSGLPVIATVKDVDASTVTLDFNHPLAGKNLHFWVKIKEVDPATDEDVKNAMMN